ncbi:hypothetical protein EJ06DRAFT_527903 [Trichodelitschia bisporula]|uniref:PSI domain-containing protein n=1 Tax=Trichodelitschia bisporula TaxID=703511 RepID=A0A6G1I3P4_9PEZI|nr:hypothetical protein EJ06DRAFT_527903 [Trichodelitschia bisporula]
MSTSPPSDPFHTCWALQSCTSCLAHAACGWCPYSSTCVPLPSSSLPPLLLPLSKAHICPLPWQERYELRTAPLGCGCSTTSLLVGLGAVGGTLVALLVGWLLVWVLGWIYAAERAERGGWVLHEGPRGERWGHTWTRPRRTWWTGWRRREDGESAALLA